MDFLAQGFALFQAGGWIMYLILLCSFLVVAIFFERYAYYRAAKPVMGDFVARLDGLLEARDYDEALALCKASDGPVESIAAKGVLCLKQQSKNLETVLEGESALAVAKLRANINHLESIVTVAPLLGLLGTVLGMMHSFRVMNIKSGEPLAITGGVGEALVATAFGLCVAVIAMAAYSYFTHRLDKIVTSMEEIAVCILRRKA